MVAQTDIKYYVHTNHKAPQLENAYGSMLNVLDACLVNGFGSQTVESLTADGTTVTADFGKAHQFLQYQVIKIDGAIQDEFNGEHRILEVTTNTITFEIAQPASVNRASGLINCSLPPLGWEKPFASENPNGGGKGAYRSKNTLLPNRPFLRVVDELDPSYNANWAKYAKVGMVEDMLDIDTMMGQQVPFDVNNPQKNWVGYGWGRWVYATPYPEYNHNKFANVTKNPRDWVIVGCKDWFYILNRTHFNRDYYYHFVPNFFGFLQDDYLQSTALSANGTENSQYINLEITLFYQHNDNERHIFCNRHKSSAYTRVYPSSVFAGISEPHRRFGIPSENTPIIISNLTLFESTSMPRGSLPSVQRVYQYQAFKHLETIDRDNRMYIAFYAYMREVGLVLFDLGVK